MTACVKAYKEGWRGPRAVRWPGRDHRCAGMKRRRNALCSKRTASGAELCSGAWSAFQPWTECRKPDGCAVSVRPWKPTETAGEWNGWFPKEIQKGGNQSESKAFRKENLRKVQDYQETWSCNGNLRKPEAQAETGLKLTRKVDNANGSYIRC